MSNVASATECLREPSNVTVCPLKPKTILITGGTTGIGLATAILLAAEGAQVIITGQNPRTLETARRELPANVRIIRSDSAAMEDARSLGHEVAKHVDSLDGVFLNAGVAQLGPFEAMPAQAFDQMFAVNVRGPYFQLQALLPLLARPSAVVFNASVLAEVGLPMASVYAATKGALVALAKSLAAELAPRGIRVNVISPGPVRTPIYGKLGMPAEALQQLEEQMAAQSLAKRMGTAEEVARFVGLLLSDESSYIIGENLAMDGGFRLA